MGAPAQFRGSGAAPGWHVRCELLTNLLQALYEGKWYSGTVHEVCESEGNYSVQCDVDPGEVSAASHWSPSRIPITQADRLHPDWLDETADTLIG